MFTPPLSSLSECPVCSEKMKEKYRKERTIVRFAGKAHLVSHAFACENNRCINYRKNIFPEEGILATKGYRFGLDVV